MDTINPFCYWKKTEIQVMIRLIKWKCFLIWKQFVFVGNQLRLFMKTNVCKCLSVYLSYYSSIVLSTTLFILLSLSKPITNYSYSNNQMSKSKSIKVMENPLALKQLSILMISQSFYYFDLFVLHFPYFH